MNTTEETTMQENNTNEPIGIELIEEEFKPAETIVDIIHANFNPPIRDTLPTSTYSNQTQILPMDVNNDKDLLDFYNAYREEYKAFLKSAKDKGLDKTSDEFIAQNEKYQKVFVVIQHLATNIITDSKIADFFKRKNITFEQILIGKDGKQIKNYFPSLATNRVSGDLTGDIALALTRRAAGGGKEINTVQHHSGLIFKMSPMSKRELVTLNSAILAARYEVGKDTRLSIFSGEDVTIQTLTVDAILPHILNSNLKTGIKVNWKSILKVTDIPNLQCSALAALYPTGYPIRRVCTHLNDEKKPCSHVHTSPTKEDGDFVPDGLLDFNNITWVDPTNLTIDDKLHLSSGFNVHTLEDVFKYQERLAMNTVGQDTTFEIIRDEELVTTITLKIPTIAEYEIAGNMYKTMLIDLFDKTIVDDGTMTQQQINLEKDNVLKAYSGALKLCKHLAWVKSINFNIIETSETSSITEIETIYKNLEVLSDIDNVKEIVDDEIEKFKEKSLVVFQGINNYICPSCNRGQVITTTRNTSLIPLHMVGYFFSTIQRSVSKILQQDQS